MLAFYGKKKTDKTFKMYNINNDTFVDRKIHATVFQDKDRKELELDVSYMNEHNPNYVFELRRI